MLYLAGLSDTLTLACQDKVLLKLGYRISTKRERSVAAEGEL